MNGVETSPQELRWTDSVNPNRESPTLQPTGILGKSWSSPKMRVQRPRERWFHLLGSECSWQGSILKLRVRCNKMVEESWRLRARQHPGIRRTSSNLN